MKDGGEVGNRKISIQVNCVCYYEFYITYMRLNEFYSEMLDQTQLGAFRFTFMTTQRVAQSDVLCSTEKMKNLALFPSSVAVPRKPIKGPRLPLAHRTRG